MASKLRSSSSPSPPSSLSSPPPPHAYAAPSSAYRYTSRPAPLASSSSSSVPHAGKKFLFAYTDEDIDADIDPVPALTSDADGLSSSSRAPSLSPTDAQDAYIDIVSSSPTQGAFADAFLRPSPPTKPPPPPADDPDSREDIAAILLALHAQPPVSAFPRFPFVARPSSSSDSRSHAQSQVRVVPPRAPTAKLNLRAPAAEPYSVPRAPTAIDASRTRSRFASPLRSVRAASSGPELPAVPARRNIDVVDVVDDARRADSPVRPYSPLPPSSPFAFSDDDEDKDEPDVAHDDSQELFEVARSIGPAPDVCIPGSPRSLQVSPVPVLVPRDQRLLAHALTSPQSPPPPTQSHPERTPLPSPPERASSPLSSPPPSPARRAQSLSPPAEAAADDVQDVAKPLPPAEACAPAEPPKIARPATPSGAPVQHEPATADVCAVNATEETKLAQSDIVHPKADTAPASVATEATHTPIRAPTPPTAQPAQADIVKAAAKPGPSRPPPLSTVNVPAAAAVPAAKPRPPAPASGTASAKKRPAPGVSRTDENPRVRVRVVSTVVHKPAPAKPTQLHAEPPPKAAPPKRKPADHADAESGATKKRRIEHAPKTTESEAAPKKFKNKPRADATTPDSSVPAKATILDNADAKPKSDTAREQKRKAERPAAGRSRKKKRAVSPAERESSPLSTCSTSERADSPPPAAPQPPAACSDADPCPHPTLLNTLIETLALSRASALSASALHRSLPSSSSPSAPTLDAIGAALAWGARTGVLCALPSSGDNVPPSYFYEPARDPDRERAGVLGALLADGAGGGRREKRKYKQYYWKPVVLARGGGARERRRRGREEEDEGRVQGWDVDWEE
ncbi:hypothetical protein FA95DRAFT_1605677 [Auriscalpium vulgare]|uniref:Uncharacterized protein n=1 Tax=Auriscalpium vulgare TaxID=40419 RepID=A0ACB8RWK4_9AGAM|nr:hypothetical protein FA95DRAFT_1605677 [Auriscalpium vulgare]